MTEVLFVALLLLVLVGFVFFIAILVRQIMRAPEPETAEERQDARDRGTRYSMVGFVLSLFDSERQDRGERRKP